ncbi:MAG TPA: DNA polymerase III subunit delta [Candidatus Sulfomarinibacteraceae bacterium]|nr:DNA polymerase III subunit delta [Candidatus Sulfomarinibacteraceae bacterium]
MFYIFHGDDAHSQHETLQALVSKLDDPSLLDLNTTRFDASVDFGQLRQACDSIPFLSKRRLVIVEDALAQKSNKALVDDLIDYLPDLPDSTRLFFLESQALRRNHRLLRFAEKQDNGYVREFSRPEGRALQKWVEQRAQQKGGQMTPRAVHMLVTSIGNDLTILDNEIEKLVLYRGGEEAISAEDVAMLCPYVAEASIFELVDALGSRNGRDAAMLLQRKLNEGADPFYLFAMIVRQFRLLLQVKELAGEGQRSAAIAKAIGIHSFVAGKLYQQCQHFSLPQLERIYAHLLETDVGVKTGRADMTTSLNLLIAALAT